MLQPANRLRAVLAILALSLAAACADQAPPPPQGAAVDGPELAGAWYQVYFDTKSFAINQRGQLIVNTVAHVVANNAATRVTVIGKTDRVGTPAANMALSQRRADAVRSALVTAGVPAARIDTSWTGEGKQEVATVDEAAEQRNRVVDVTVVKTNR
jgi:peptidoglycan-associated lipoprotein